MIRRKLKTDEIALTAWIIKDTPGGKAIIDELNSLIIEEMDDGAWEAYWMLKWRR